VLIPGAVWRDPAQEISVTLRAALDQMNTKKG